MYRRCESPVDELTKVKKFWVNANVVHSFEKRTLLIYSLKFDVSPITTSLLLTSAV